MREGRDRRRAVEPQLGLGAQAGSRPARAAADHREPAPVAGPERGGRGRDRLSHAPASCTASRPTPRWRGTRTGSATPSSTSSIRAIIGRDEFDAADAGCRRQAQGRALHAPPTAGRSRRRRRPPSPSPRAGLGAKVLTNCAVRTVEREGGKVAAVVTEKGRIRTATPWSWRAAPGRSLFVGNLGIRLPQLTVINSVMRTAPLEGGPESALWMTDYAFRQAARRRLHHRQRCCQPARAGPDSFRFLKDFMPALQIEWRSHQLRVGRRFLQECRLQEALDRRGPRPCSRTSASTIPTPGAALDHQRRCKSLSRDFPVFAKAQVVQEWAGRIDVTPDIVPVISPVDTVPGPLRRHRLLRPRLRHRARRRPAGRRSGHGPRSGGRPNAVPASRVSSTARGPRPWAMFDGVSAGAGLAHRHSKAVWQQGEETLR